MYLLLLKILLELCVNYYYFLLLQLLKVLESKICILEQEKKDWTQENEKLIKKVNDLEDEAVLKNAKLLELGNLFLIPQVEMKSIFCI